MLRDAWTPDRRRGDRRPVRLPLPVHIEGFDSPAHVCELGPGGMVLQTGGPLPAGSAVVFSLGLGADSSGPIEGRVTHSRLMLPQRHGDPPAYLTGVAFAHVTPDQADRVAGWLTAIDQHGHDRPTRVP